MKKILYTASTFAFAALAVASDVWGATKCVALDGYKTTCNSNNAAYYEVNWSTTCKTNNKTVPISGVGVCSDKAGSRIGQSSVTITVANNTENNKNCWCRMTSPGVSKWVFSYQSFSAGVCAQGCASSCASETVMSDSYYLSSLFFDLQD